METNQTPDLQHDKSDHVKYLKFLIIGSIIAGFILACLRMSELGKDQNSNFLIDLFFLPIVLMFIGFLLGSILELMMMLFKRRRWNMESFVASAIVFSTISFLAHIYDLLK